MTAREAGQWIGDAIPGGAVAAALGVGTVGVTIAGVQPVLFGALLTAGRISIAQIGHAATVELLALGIGVILGGSLFEHRPVRHTAIGAAMLLGIGNLATLAASGEGVTLARLATGIAGGVLIWIATAVVVRSPRPTFLSAAFLLSQALVQCAVASSIAFLAPGAPNGVPFAIAGLAVLAAVVTPALPVRFAALPKEPTASGLPSMRGWGVLGAILLLQAAIVGAWVYMEPMAREAGLAPTQVAFSTPAANAAQIAGGLGAILLATRLPWFIGLTCATLGLMGVLFGLSTLPHGGWFVATEMAFGALWTFTSPFLTPFAIDNDPTRHTAEFGPSAMLVGSGLGPLVASALTSEEHPAEVLRLSTLLAVTALALILTLFATRRRSTTQARGLEDDA